MTGSDGIADSAKRRRNPRVKRFEKAIPSPPGMAFCPTAFSPTVRRFVAYRFATASIVSYDKAFLRHPPPNLTLRSLAKMPKGTIKFTCLRINLKRISTFEPDESQIGSLIEFDLKIGDRRLNALSVEVRQRYGTDFQNEPLEVGNVIGYNGPWNSEEFRDLCGQYYRDIIGSSGVGRAIKTGERKLIERVAIRVDRREEINLHSSAETTVDAKAG